jgi:acetylornithine/N-succinyldiaminopimelate aminotransferase
VPNTDFVVAARAQKIILIGAGDNVVRLLPPLIISDADITEAFNRLDAACAAMEAELKTKAQPGAAQ